MLIFWNWNKKDSRSSGWRKSPPVEQVSGFITFYKQWHFRISSAGMLGHIMYLSADMRRLDSTIKLQNCQCHSSLLPMDIRISFSYLTHSPLSHTSEHSRKKTRLFSPANINKQINDTVLHIVWYWFILVVVGLHIWERVLKSFLALTKVKWTVTSPQTKHLSCWNDTLYSGTDHFLLYKTSKESQLRWGSGCLCHLPWVRDIRVQLTEVRAGGKDMSEDTVGCPFV